MSKALWKMSPYPPEFKRQRRNTSVAGKDLRLELPLDGMVRPSIVQQGQDSEFAVIVFPFASRDNFFSSVPMFHYFALFESKQIIKSRMVAANSAFADAEHKTPFGENPMNALIVDVSATLTSSR